MLHRFLYILLICLAVVFPSFIEKTSTHRPAYKIYSKEGKEVTFSEMMKDLKKSEVILFGELHNNPIAHWMELSILKSIDSSKVMVGGEMFSPIEQSLINNYLSNQLAEEVFKEQVQLWNNYNTDYKPILDYCQLKHIPFVGTNADRKVARIVARNGIQSLDTLESSVKKQIAPVPLEIDYNLPGYKKMMESDTYGHGGNMKFMVQAQALKDATMAYFIHSNYQSDKIFLHLNGAYHSDNFEGIYWYLKKSKPSIKVKTISTIEQKDLKKLEKLNYNRADYILVVPDDMTKTY